MLIIATFSLIAPLLGSLSFCINAVRKRDARLAHPSNVLKPLFFTDLLLLNFSDGLKAKGAENRNKRNQD
jgi:hypothetical protein